MTAWTTRRLTRTSLVLCIIAAALLGGTIATAAQNYPWCAQYSGRAGGAMNCGFVSFEQCMATVRGMGGFCIVNNTYQPPAGPPRHSPHKRHVRKSS